MRITTQMLNETAKRTGIPINQPNLLSYINNESGSGGNTLLDALNKNKDSKVSSAAAANYKKLEKSADSLKEQAEKLAEEGEESFLEKIKAGGTSGEACKVVESYVEHYNAALSSLSKSEGALNQYYSKMLQEAADEHSEALEKIGITAGKDGKLSIDAEKLKAASIDDIQSVFSGSDGLAARTAFIADRISSNAQANIESISSHYNINGNLQSQLVSQYDFWS